MAVSASGLAAELSSLEASDSVLQEVATRVKRAIKDLGVDKDVPGLQIYFVDFAKAPLGPNRPIYYTDSCLSVLPSIVVVNAQFMFETEAAIRAFGLFDELANTPYLRNDACMFGLVKRVTEGGKLWLEMLRKFEEGKQSAERFATDALMMTILFFCAHEVGHLKDGVNIARYTSFLDPTKPLEARLANAAMKLRRHASEFGKYGFDLPGWQAAVDPGEKVFASAQRLGATIAAEDKINAEWFEKEKSADDAAVQLIIRYLSSQSGKYRGLLVRGLFAVSLYAWYKDLLAFCIRLNVPRHGPKPALSFELMRNPQAYIAAASLFGDVHRSTIFRSAVGIQAILGGAEHEDAVGAKSNTSDSLRARAMLLWQKLFKTEKSASESDDAQWKYQSAQRHVLLAIHMDTVVKFAYVGASMPFIREAEDKHGAPKVLIINFEGIDESLARLQRLWTSQDTRANV